MRDNFTAPAKRELAHRVGVRCSNPDCRKSTSGPADDPKKHVNIGIAAHITAAAPGGPRYDPTLTSEERERPENGIWLCQNCAKLIDSDLDRFTPEFLRLWKAAAETNATEALQGISIGESSHATSYVVDAVLTTQLEELSSLMSDDVRQQLEDMRQASREGRRNEAAEWLKGLRDDKSRWTMLSDEVKAMLLIFEASLELDRSSDIEKAKILAKEAHELAPHVGQIKLQTLITRKEQGPDVAIEVLNGQEDIDSLNLKAAMLLEMGRIEECLEILDF